MPLHIAIIMDGNRRWARARGLPPVAGHQKVANDVLDPLIEHAADLGIKYVTLWAFSTENWRREPAEVRDILSIFHRAVKRFGKKLHRRGVRIKTIGDLTRFDEGMQKSISQLVEKTKNNRRITVVFALNYGGRDEILRAMKKIPAKQYSNITIEQFSNLLDTAGIPDPELIIRPSGEQRLSGFLTWQSQYSEFYFPSWHMPEFTPQRLDEAVAEYQRRSRRFGK